MRPYIGVLLIFLEFIKNYLDQSPISHIGLIGIKGSHAVKLSDLSGNVKAHLQVRHGRTLFLHEGLLNMDRHRN